MRKFVISETILRSLLSAEAELLALQAAGVDNWDGCDNVEWEGTSESEQDLSQFEEIEEIE